MISALYTVLYTQPHKDCSPSYFVKKVIIRIFDIYQNGSWSLITSIYSYSLFARLSVALPEVVYLWYRVSFSLKLYIFNVFFNKSNRKKLTILNSSFLFNVIEWKNVLIFRFFNVKQIFQRNGHTLYMSY